jgi:hypothetical protein
MGKQDDNFELAIFLELVGRLNNFRPTENVTAMLFSHVTAMHKQGGDAAVQRFCVYARMLKLRADHVYAATYNSERRRSSDIRAWHATYSNWHNSQRLTPAPAPPALMPAVPGFMSTAEQQNAFIRTSVERTQARFQDAAHQAATKYIKYNPEERKRRMLWDFYTQNIWPLLVEHTATLPAHELNSDTSNAGRRHMTRAVSALRDPPKRQNNDEPRPKPPPPTSLQGIQTWVYANYMVKFGIPISPAAYFDEWLFHTCGSGRGSSGRGSSSMGSSSGSGSAMASGGRPARRAMRRA